MSRSVLLQLARDSITEVLEASRHIDSVSLLQIHPLLQTPMKITVNIYIKNELRGSSSSKNTFSSLLNEIIKNAKKASFEDTNFTPLTVSQYLQCEIELLLYTNEGILKEKDNPILNEFSKKDFEEIYS